MSESVYRQRATVPWDKVVKVTHCVDCFPGSCPVNAFVKDGVVVREESSGDLPVFEEGVPDLNPMVCQKGLAWSRQLASPDRLLYPLRRKGERGSGEWERISWDDALQEIAEAMVDAIEEVGPEAIVQEGSPEIGMLAASMRFTSAIGATQLDVNASINDFWAGFHQVWGKFYATFSMDDMFHSDTILIWHANPAFNTIPSFHYVTEARYRGAHVVLISPDVSPSHTHADIHLPVNPGTDAALALAMCQVVLTEGIADLEFVRTQTDLALLVRKDTGRYLRDSDVVAGGLDDHFYHLAQSGTPVPADRGDLRLAGDVLLDGVCTVSLHDGTQVEVEPLLSVVRRKLDSEYTPEAVATTCGTAPDAIRRLARLIAAGPTHVMVPGGMTKYYHGDLIGRAVLLLLGLTGNWGRKGAGTGGWSTGVFDGHLFAMSKPFPGAEGTNMVIGMLESVRQMMKASDPTMTDELAAVEMWRQVSQQAGMNPPFFFWYRHAGFGDRQNDPANTDPSQLRPFQEYLQESLDKGWWKDADRPNHPPRVLIEIAGNMLRRTRGGKTVLLERLWPQLSKVVVVDVRMSETARYADIVLPAAGTYEKMGFGMPTPWTMLLGFSDAAVDPPGEALGEWEMLLRLLAAMHNEAQRRGLEAFRDRNGMVRKYEDLVNQYTLNGTILNEEHLADEMIRDSELAGNLPEGTTLKSLQARGWTKYANWGSMAMAQGQASPFPTDETHSPLRNHVEQGHPYPTLTRRAQFLLEHEWFEEAGEALPVHKDPPALGGSHRWRLTSGHNRWSIHAMNTTNPVLLNTHRGKPFVLMNEGEAEELGVADDGVVRVFNDHGEFRVHARTSPAQQPGMLTVYNGFEGFMFPDGAGPNECEPGIVKWLGLAGGYGHLNYTPTEWQPIPADRAVTVSVEAAEL